MLHEEALGSEWDEAEAFHPILSVYLFNIGALIIRIGFLQRGSRRVTIRDLQGYYNIGALTVRKRFWGPLQNIKEPLKIVVVLIKARIVSVYLSIYLSVYIYIYIHRDVIWS